MALTPMSTFACTRGLAGHRATFRGIGMAALAYAQDARTRRGTVVEAPATDDAKGVVSWEATV